jgi:hypothetical protein
MTFCLYPLGLNVRHVLKPKGFEDVDGHCLPIESGTKADADGRADVAELSDDFGKKQGRSVGPMVGKDFADGWMRAGSHWRDSAEIKLVRP